MAKRNETGKDGESVARAFLEKKGYKITHTTGTGIIMSWTS